MQLTKTSGAGAFGGIATIVSIDSLSQITITSATANTTGSITFNTRGPAQLLSVSSTSGLWIGAKIEIISGTGALSEIADTIVTAISSDNNFTVTPAPTTDLLNANISLSVDPSKQSLDFEMFRVPISSKGYVNDDGVNKIILTRPAVEAGERLGFLPGDLNQKVDPYLRPLYDALYDLAGYDTVNKMFERGAIEVAPLAYMRGRTLNQSFIILDEAQNTTPEQMKMFLTRIGFGTKAVITGDVTQIDLQRHQKSGLVEAQKVLKDIKGIAMTHFLSGDVVRHPLVQKIVNAYEEYELKNKD
jgi:hypothetical protein